MKKILLSLLMLCGMTAAWAGEGDGSKEHPYSGEWSLFDLYPKLHEGDYLALDCHIKGGAYLNVIDVRLGKEVLPLWDEWSPADCISASYLSGHYKQYGKDNPLDNRKEQKFVVVQKSQDSKRPTDITIKGYFTGFYSNPDADGFVHVESSKQMEIVIKGNENVQGNDQAKIILTQDIYLSDIDNATFCSTFKGSLDGNGHTIYGSHDGTRQKRTYLFDKCVDATFKDLTFKNIEVRYVNEETQGMIAPLVNRCEFDNIKVDNCHIIGNTGVGLLGNATACNIKNIEVTNCKITGDDYDVGGIVGWSTSGTIENVYIKGCYLSVGGHTVGGIVGESHYTNYWNCHVDDQTCIFGDGGYQNVSEAGGIAGCTFTGVLRECMNSALVAGDGGGIGGIVGVGIAVIDHCVNTGIILSIDGDDLGEVFEKYKNKSFGTPITTIKYNGNEYKVQQLDEASRGKVASDDCLAGMIGKGSTESAIKNCVNYGPYYSKGDDVSGMVGYISGGKVLNCINAPSAIDVFPDSEDTHGGIIGKVDNGPVLGEEHTPIMCCLNLNGQKMIGVAEKGIKGTGYSGSDNYSNGSSHSSIDKPVDMAMVHSGLLAYRMGRPVAYSDEDLLCWRQDLSGDAKTIPSFDPTLEVVNELYLASATPPITTAAQLREFADKVNAGQNPYVAYLGADISFVDENVVHHPIGNRDHPFTGIFDGNGHTISGLQYHISSDKEGVGLFGVVGANTEIRNVIVDGTSAVTNANAGAAGIVGLVYLDADQGDVVIERCGSNATVTANKHAGGILGRIMTGEDGAPNLSVKIKDCYSKGIISAKEGNSGLLCGYMKDHGVVTNCWSAGQLRTRSNDAPFSTVNSNGGECELMVGYNNKLTISNCYIVNPVFQVDKWDEYNENRLQKGVEIPSNFQVGFGALAFLVNENSNDARLSLTWEQNLGTDDYPVFGRKAVYHTRNVSESSNGYGTVCLPYPLQSNDSIRYYTFREASDGNNEVQLKFEYAEGMIPAGTPLLFRVSKTGENTFCNADVDFRGLADAYPINPADGAWRFWGTYVNREITDNFAEEIYYVSNGEIRNAKKTTIAPFRAYFVGPNIHELNGSNASQAKAVKFVLADENGETTALELVGDDLVPVQQGGKSYSVMGTEVGDGYRGLVIRNGKKVIQNR